LFFATDMDLRRERGARLREFLVYDHADVDQIYTDGLTDALLREETPPACF